MKKRPDPLTRKYRNMSLEKAREMRRLRFVEGMKLVEIAPLFGVKPHSVSRVISGHVWADPEERRP